MQPLSFTQQLQQCSRGGKTRPLSKLLSPLQSEPQSPIYASPPLSPVHDAPNMFGELLLIISLNIACISVEGRIKICIQYFGKM